jgi:hypothetical protein
MSLLKQNIMSRVDWSTLVIGCLCIVFGVVTSLPLFVGIGIGLLVRNTVERITDYYLIKYKRA